MFMTSRRTSGAWRISRYGAALLAAGVAMALAVPASGSARASAGADWPQFHFNAARSGVTPETTIGTANVSTLTTLWSKSLPAASYTSPMVVQNSAGTDLVYVGDAAGTFFAYNAATGAQVWMNKISSKPIQASAAVYKGTVYIPANDGSLYLLNAVTGVKRCSINLGGGVTETSPAVVAAPDGSGPLVFLGGLTKKEWAVYGAGNTHGQCKVDWTFTASTFPGSYAPPGYGTDAQGRHVVVFGSKDNDDAVYSVNVATGQMIWRHQTSTQPEQDVGGAPVISAPGVNGFAGGVVYIEGKTNVVYALDLTTGATLWTFTAGTPGLTASAGALVGNTLVIGSINGVYGLNATTGKQIWHALSGIIVAAPSVSGPAGHKVAFIGGTKGNLFGLSVATGATLWTSPGTSAGYYASPAVSRGRVFDVDVSGKLTSYALP
jgi:outer membrane protein assembly factor BamB